VRSVFHVAKFRKAVLLSFACLDTNDNKATQKHTDNILWQSARRQPPIVTKIDSVCWLVCARTICTFFGPRTKRQCRLLETSCACKTKVFYFHWFSVRMLRIFLKNEAGFHWSSKIKANSPDQYANWCNTNVAGSVGGSVGIWQRASSPCATQTLLQSRSQITSPGKNVLKMQQNDLHHNH